MCSVVTLENIQACNVTERTLKTHYTPPIGPIERFLTG